MRITRTIEAIQWNKPGDHPQVVAAGPMMARRGQAGYISGMSPFMTCWVEVEPLKEKPPTPDGSLFTPILMELEHPDTKELYWRHIWPFAYWKFQGPTIESPIDSDDLFYKDCYLVEKGLWHRETAYPEWVPHGWLKPPAIGGRVVVYPSDWIIIGEDIRTIMSNDDAKKFYPELLKGN